MSERLSFAKTDWLTKQTEDLTWADFPEEITQGRAISILVLRGMPYREYLKTEWWNGVRLRAFKRYRGQCLCGKDARDGHHAEYSRKGFEWPEDVIALCRDCHTAWHSTWALQAKAGMEGQ